MCLSYLSNLCKFPAYHAKHVATSLILQSFALNSTPFVQHFVAHTHSLSFFPFPWTTGKYIPFLGLGCLRITQEASSNNLYKYLFLLPIFIYPFLPPTHSHSISPFKGVKFNTTCRRSATGKVKIYRSIKGTKKIQKHLLHLPCKRQRNYLLICILCWFCNLNSNNRSWHLP